MHKRSQKIAMETLFACYDIAEDMFTAVTRLQTNDSKLSRPVKNRLLIIDDNWKSMKKVVRDTELSYQVEFGDRSELFKEILLRLSDIMIDDPGFAEEILNKIKEHKPTPGLNTYIFKI